MSPILIDRYDVPGRGNRGSFLRELLNSPTALMAATPGPHSRFNMASTPKSSPNDWDTPTSASLSTRTATSPPASDPTPPTE